MTALILALSAAGFFFWRSRSSGSIDSLAVLPFVNASGTPDADWLGDGINDTLTESLSELLNLKVMSQSAMFRYKGKDSDARAAGKELGVRAVLTGRLAECADNLSVSAELVRVDDESHLWGEQ